MNKIILILGFIFCVFNMNSQNRFKSYTEPNKKQAVGITLSFLGVGFIGCGVSYYNTGNLNNNRVIRPIFVSIGGVLTITGLITLITNK